MQASADQSTREPRASHEAASSRSRVPRLARILYAEDDALVRTFGIRVLTRAGYEIAAVENGQLAWEALQSGEFDLLLTDNDMPELTGIELVSRVRRSNAELPIILASASAGFYSEKEYRWLNFSACLQKPFLPSDLVEAVGKALRTS